ncbi:MAG TPA: endonuclease/exonuclease/phosphatase family protein [bacterium]|nr:hypothetical protein [Chlamydiota bacterium]HOE26839.1 endonuclease/exonuclease/phosphatase family protein [bacterium]HQM52824.1 endonuclease/exonuclease/phosphatase family protein [bacterium]
MMPLIALCAAHGCVSGPREAMRIDGRFDDWAGVRPACVDPRGDGGHSGVDFGRVWICDDRDALYFRFDTGKEISLQSRNGIALYLDTDDSAETGIPVGGIGADVSWRFGAREGVDHRFAPARIFNAYEAGMVTGPTVTSREHEVKMRKDAGTRAVRWLLRDEGDGRGDIAPDQGAAGRYEFTGAEVTRTGARPLAKRSARDVRVVSNNVYEDNIFNREAEFSRILNALAPDVLALQEIRRHRAAQVAEVVTRMTGGAWHTADHADCFTLSRYPVLSATKVAAGIGALLDLPDETYARDLFLVNLHLGAGTKDERRQREVDEVVAALRDLRAPGRPGSLPPGTPIVIVGDLNLVGLARQLATLLTGDIADEARFGPDSPPDWDGTAMTDLAPSHLSAPEAYTWANYHRRGFGPGRIDYVIYADSAVAVANRFVLSTDTMSDADLAAGGLRRDDTRTASDHLPVVADLVLP